MIIKNIKPQDDYKLKITTDNGRIGIFDVKPYLEFDAFAELKKQEEFNKVINGGYFVEWDCGADLSADAVEAHLTAIKN